jgi:hypothetical protein
MAKNLEWVIAVTKIILPVCESYAQQKLEMVDEIDRLLLAREIAIELAQHDDI